MNTETIPDAAVEDVEAALVEQYGKNNIREKSTTATDTIWLFKLTSKTMGRCTAQAGSDGVTVSMSPHTPKTLWILTGLGFFLIIPGLILTAYILVLNFITGMVIKSRFPKFAEAVRGVAKTRGCTRS